MRTSKVSRYILAVAAALVMLAGCSGSSSPIAPAPLGQAPNAGNQTVQQRAFRANRLNSLLAMSGNVVSGHREKGSTFMDAAAAGKPLIFIANGSGASRATIRQHLSAEGTEQESRSDHELVWCRGLSDRYCR